MVKKAEPEVNEVDRSKEDTVAMTIYVPTSIHKRIKIAAAEKEVGLYQLVIKTLDEQFK